MWKLEDFTEKFKCINDIIVSIFCRFLQVLRAVEKLEEKQNCPKVRENMPVFVVFISLY